MIHESRDREINVSQETDAKTTVLKGTTARTTRRAGRPSDSTYYNLGDICCRYTFEDETAHHNIQTFEKKNYTRVKKEYTVNYGWCAGR